MEGMFSNGGLFTYLMCDVSRLAGHIDNVNTSTIASTLFLCDSHYKCNCHMHMRVMKQFVGF